MKPITKQVIQQVKCVLNFSFTGSVLEYSPLNSELTIKLEEVCNWKGSESNYHKQLIISNQQRQINYIQCHLNLEGYQSYLAYTTENFSEKKQHFQMKFFSLKFSPLIIWLFFISAQLITFTHRKHAVSYHLI